VDLVGGCGTIAIVRSWWLAILTFAFVAIAAPADAQVFKPRGKSGATKPAKKAAPAATEKTEKPEKKAAARTSSKKPIAKKSRAAESARPNDLTPAPKKGKKGKKSDEDEEDVASNLGDDEVIITDDDD
jgi:hypothetical protein